MFKQSIYSSHLSSWWTLLLDQRASLTSLDAELQWRREQSAKPRQLSLQESPWAVQTGQHQCRLKREQWLVSKKLQERLTLEQVNLISGFCVSIAASQQATWVCLCFRQNQADRANLGPASGTTEKWRSRSKRSLQQFAVMMPNCNFHNDSASNSLLSLVSSVLHWIAHS